MGAFPIVALTCEIVILGFSRAIVSHDTPVRAGESLAIVGVDVMAIVTEINKASMKFMAFLN